MHLDSTGREKSMTKTICLALAVACPALSTTPSAHAQWSDDPTVNLAIADRSGEQVQTKIAPTVDGGAYVSWFDNATGGYDVYLQRLDADGIEQWAHNGVLVADRSFSSTQDYGLSIDATGNALLAFRDTRTGSTQITAALVTPDGVLAWGTPGVQLTTGGAFVAAPKITGTTDGHIVVAWTNNSDTRLQKLDATGAPQWTPGVTISDTGGGSFSASDLHESNNGSVIVSMVLGFGGRLYAQRVSATGSFVWDSSPINIFNNGNLQFGNFPTFVTDGSGGAVFAWYTSSPLQCSVQHILADGTEQFPHNGVVTSTLNSQFRTGPGVAYNPTTAEVFVSWIETNTLQSRHGVYAQKVSSDGTRQWTDTGRVIVPVGDREQTQARTLAFNDGAMVFWVETQSFGNQRVRATRLDSAGNNAWPEGIIDPSSILASKSRLAASLSANNEALLAWRDGRNDAGDIYGQNLHGDGSMGTGSLGDFDGDGDVDLFDFEQFAPCQTGPGGSAAPPCDVFDFNADNDVDFADFSHFQRAFTP